MLSAVAAGDFGNLEIGFRVVQLTPTVRMQALESSVKSLPVMPQKSSSFNASTGLLQIPELYVDDALGFTGLQFRLIDAAQLIFELGSN